MLKGSEIKEKSIIVINNKPFFVAFKSNVAGCSQKTILIGLSIEEIIERKFWPIDNSSYDFLNNYVIDESGVSCDNKINDCRTVSGIEKMKLQTALLNNELSEVATYLN